MWPFKERLTEEQLTFALAKMWRDLAKEITDLRNAVEAAVKVYKCIICGSAFARLPGQSDKRCMACQREIKSAASPAIGQSNSGRRPPGHNTRGIHKGPKP